MNTNAKDIIETEQCPVCRRCHRKLRTAEAQARGFGKVCWLKNLQEKSPKPLFIVRRENKNGKN